MNRTFGGLLVGGSAWLVVLGALTASCSDDGDGNAGDGRGEAGQDGRAGGGGSGRAGSGGSANTAGSGAGGTSSGTANDGGTGTGGADGSDAGTTGTAAAGGTSNSGGSGAAAGEGASGAADPGGAGPCAGDDCEPRCGNGVLEDGETCDDGNATPGDGCSAACTVESGHSCTTVDCSGPGSGCVLRLPAVFRDFNAVPSPNAHPDFEPTLTAFDATLGLVESLLDEEGKPVATDVATSSYGYIHGKATFAEWYRDAPPAAGPIAGEIVLWDDGNAGFVNRWGANGEPWIGYPDASNYTFCADGCAACGTPPPGQVCLDACAPLAGASFACMLERREYDGNPLFFPIDSAAGVLPDTRGEGRVPEIYGWLGYPWESDVSEWLGMTAVVPTATAPFPSLTHNFSFTTEVRFHVRYDGSQLQILSILGDDDIWVFVNGRLAIDLGGWHTPLEATLSFGGGNVASVTYTSSEPNAEPLVREEPASAFGLEPGNVYEIAVFHAERQAEGSSFKLGVHGFDFSRGVCAPR